MARARQRPQILTTFHVGARVLRTIALEKAVRRRHAQRIAGRDLTAGGTSSLAGAHTAAFPDAASDDPAVPLHEPTASTRTGDPVLTALPDELRRVGAQTARPDGSELTDRDPIGTELAEAELQFETVRAHHRRVERCRRTTTDHGREHRSRSGSPTSGRQPADPGDRPGGGCASRTRRTTRGPRAGTARSAPAAGSR